MTVCGEWEAEVFAEDEAPCFPHYLLQEMWSKNTSGNDESRDPQARSYVRSDYNDSSLLANSLGRNALRINRIVIPPEPAFSVQVKNGKAIQKNWLRQLLKCHYDELSGLPEIALAPAPG